MATLKSFTFIADSRIDPDSPLDTSLFFDLRDNDSNSSERIGIATGSGIDVENHGHLGLDVDGSVPLGSISPAIVFLDVPVTKVSFAGAVGFTNIDVSGDTLGTDVAKIGIFQISIDWQGTFTAAANYNVVAAVAMRKDLLTIVTPDIPEVRTGLQFQKTGGVAQVWGGEIAGELHVPLESQITEYTIIFTGAVIPVISGEINFIGYIK